MAAPERVSNVAESLGRYSWHREARCRDEDPTTFFPDDKLTRTAPGSPTVLLPLLICAGCPVRRDCLRESLRVWSVALREGLGVDMSEPVTVRARGVWGATTWWDRERMRHLPTEEAAEVLELELPKRLARHVRAFRANLRAHPRVRTVRHVRRVRAMLAERNGSPEGDHTRASLNGALRGS